MKTHLFFLAFLLSTASCGFSQDSLRASLSQDSSIRSTLVEGYKYPRVVYSANGQILSNREITARLRLYDKSANELKSSKNAQTGMIVCLGVMLGSGIAAGAERDQGNSGVQYTFGGIAVGALVGAIVAGVQRAIHYDKAIRVYNKRFVP